MFCPKCRYEYDFGIAICPDCKVRLVAELPPEDETEYVDLVTILTTGDAGVAAMAKSILEAAEIQYYVKGESTRALFAAGFIEIQVRPDDVEDARPLMDDMKRDLRATDPRRAEMGDEEDDYEGEEGEEKE